MDVERTPPYNSARGPLIAEASHDFVVPELALIYKEADSLYAAYRAPLRTSTTDVPNDDGVPVLPAGFQTGWITTNLGRGRSWQIYFDHAYPTFGVFYNRDRIIIEQYEPATRRVRRNLNRSFVSAGVLHEAPVRNLYVYKIHYVSITIYQAGSEYPAFTTVYDASRGALRVERVGRDGKIIAERVYV